MFFNIVYLMIFTNGACVYICARKLFFQSQKIIDLSVIVKDLSVLNIVWYSRSVFNFNSEMMIRLKRILQVLANVAKL